MLTQNGKLISHDVREIYESCISDDGDGIEAIVHIKFDRPISRKDQKMCWAVKPRVRKFQLMLSDEVLSFQGWAMAASAYSLMIARKGRATIAKRR